MKKLKENWDINNNWQLIFPFLGIIALGYSSYKLSYLFLKNFHFSFTLLLSSLLFFVLLKLILKIFKKLEKKWDVNYRWEMINIFLVFATTGSSSVFVSRPLIKLMGINKENLPTFAYWILYIAIGFLFYQILLVLIGWLFGQHKFFWNFEKKMLRRIGLKRFVD
ncbi:hypothetical protein A8C32_01095 [Flavivirga aquatica]|uniref:DUF6787 domain-containing protein n=1 Tax=Flavivirga aquatica TaxID=1849968 RepID=A0A1E5TC29_9FLAO|nr:DUF6787 family protein [Flavivirga aquatica]OEK08918.1 hypothetical protein A8C32_01095 [Flavivirga aquatica]